MGLEQNLHVHDPVCALASVGGDPDFLREIAGLVQAAWPTLLGNIRVDLAAGDLCALETDARLAKAAAEYVSAGRAYMSALQLQMMAGQNDLPGAQQATANLEGEVARLQIVLSTIRNSGDSRPHQAVPVAGRSICAPGQIR
jgi:HPt (histidine-containing phosphotransfer) domain-containing protein